MSILELIGEISDPRCAEKVKYPLPTLLFSTLCAVLCGAESWCDVSDFCEAKSNWLSNYIDLSSGIPSEWTYRRLFILLAPECLESLLRDPTSSLLQGKYPSAIAIDGKALRGSKRHNLGCLQSVSAICHDQGLTLAETQVDHKSHEIAAIPLLLDVLQLKGTTVTIDAAGCQKTIAETIINKGGHYILSLKKNHPKLYEAVSSHLQENCINSDHRLKDYFDKGHGRLVRRRYFCSGVKAIPLAHDWQGLQSVIAVETISSKNIDQNTTSEWRYYLSSHQANQSLLPDMIKNHWSIENKLHWVLDVHLKEDDDRKAERKSAKAFAALRRMALNIVRVKDSKPKKSLRRKLKCAGWDHDYLLTLLS